MKNKSLRLTAALCLLLQSGFCEEIEETEYEDPVSIEENSVFFDYSEISENKEHEELDTFQTEIDPPQEKLLSNSCRKDERRCSPLYMMPYILYSGGESIGICDSYGSVGLLISPCFQPCQSYPLLDTSLHIFEQGRYGVSAGFGYRFLSCNAKNSDGFFLYYDALEDHSGTFHQVGFSFEKTINCFEFRLNTYFPLNYKTDEELCAIFDDYDNTGSDTPYIVEAYKYNISLIGMDAEAGFRYHIPCSSINAYTGVGVYYFHQNCCFDITGVKGVARFNLCNYLTIEGQISWDRCNHTMGRGILQIQIPFDLIYECCSLKTCPACPIQRVYRDGPIHHAPCCDYECNF